MKIGIINSGYSNYQNYNKQSFSGRDYKSEIYWTRSRLSDLRSALRSAEERLWQLEGWRHQRERSEVKNTIFTLNKEIEKVESELQTLLHNQLYHK